MPDTLEANDWDTIVGRIKAGRCTPFLGAGACYGHLPTGKKLAGDWADKFGYPFVDKNNLPNVAQYVAMHRDQMWPKEYLLEAFAKCKPPDFTREEEPHGLLASLDLKTYITTNYDDYIVKALEAAGKKPVREFCRWNEFIQDMDSKLPADYAPDISNPLVFHLHGVNTVAESIVLTEDDYLQFLVNLAGNEKLLPSDVKAAMGSTSLLFLGYSLEDINFRVLFRSLDRRLRTSTGRTHISVQLLPPNASKNDQSSAEKYLDTYFQRQNVKVFWGTCEEFVKELRKRL